MDLFNFVSFLANILGPDSADIGSDTEDSAGPHFEDMVRITITVGPWERHRKEIDTVDQIWAAWIARRDLDVSIRDIYHLG